MKPHLDTLIENADFIAEALVELTAQEGEK